MQKATRHARHYVGMDSEINVGKSPTYGTTAKNKGPGSTNTSGELLHGQKERRELYAQEVDDAIKIRQELRQKKAERGERRTQKRIEAVKERYRKGAISAKERDEIITRIHKKHQEQKQKSRK